MKYLKKDHARSTTYFLVNFLSFNSHLSFSLFEMEFLHSPPFRPHDNI